MSKKELAPEDAAVAAPARGLYYGWVVVGVGFTAAMLTYGISYYSFSVFLKPMAAEFGWSRGATSLAMTFYSLVYGGLGMVMGTLTDRYGPRITVSIGAVLLGLGGVLMSRIDSLWQLYFCYAFFMGGALATAWVPLSTTVSRWFVAKRGLAVGILAGGAGAAAILGAPLTTYLVAQFGWRQAYLILGVIAFVSIGITAQFLRHSPKSMGLQMPASENTSAGTAKSAAHENVAPIDFTPWQALHTAQFWLLFVIFMTWGIAFVIPLIHTISYATDLGLSSSVAATVMILIGLSSMISRVAVGAMVDRFGAKNVLLAALVFQVLVMLSFIMARNATSLYIVGILYGVAYGACVSAIPGLVSRLFGVAAMGAIFGIAYFGSGLGQSVGPPMAGYVYDITSSYEGAFLIGAGILSFAALLTLLVRPPRRKEPLPELASAGERK
ncbi:MAG: MFS transporter [Dehalococcoidia bacterium]|nr:MFS transporter [Dehalococcoidia bacterium]